MEDIIDNIKIENRQLSEQELDAIYFYLNMEYDNMTEQQKKMWYDILSIVDKDFFDEYENQDGGSE